MTNTQALTVGLISDTHGLLRPEAVEALRGSDFIVHAGDIGDAKVLDGLARLAPITAIRGNNDKDEWAAALPQRATLQVGAIQLFIIHSFAELDFDPAGAGYQVVVAGHSHRPEIREEGGVLFINPGSAGPRRFRLPIAVARLSIQGVAITPKLLEL